MRGRGRLGTMLAGTMAASTFMLVVFGVLASDLIATFAIDRAQVGALVTTSSVLAALASPVVGPLVDRIGARTATILTLLAGAGALASIAVAPTYWLLVAAAAATALPQAGANPATNKLIAEHVEPGARGVVTGVKQSGVQVGVFIGGATLPALAGIAGWRVAVLAFAVIFAVVGIVARAMLPDDAPATAPKGDQAGSTRRELPLLVRRITVYGFLLGVGGSTIFTYLPLYAEESLGLSGPAAGAAVSLTGAVGIAARIGWGRAAELRLGSVRSLRAMAVLAVVAAGLLLAAQGVPLLLWVAAVAAGASASAWNAVGMLAIIQGLPADSTGRASGLVMFGFLTGLGLGAPAFGWSVDRLGSYTPGWTAAGAVFALALLVLVGVREPSEETADRPLATES